jgi:hypothetical protein
LQLCRRFFVYLIDLTNWKNETFVYFFTLFILSITLANAQEKFTINGYIKDSLTGETLIGANIGIKPEGRGTTSNQYGFFSLTLPKGKYQLIISFVGYQLQEKTITLNQNIQSNFLLLTNTALYNEVTVVGKKETTM